MIKPLFDKIIVKKIENDERTRSGIIVNSSSHDKTNVVEVIEVGPGGLVDGNVVEMCVKKGDRAIINKFTGTEVNYENSEFLIIKQSDILAITE